MVNKFGRKLGDRREAKKLRKRWTLSKVETRAGVEYVILGKKGKHAKPMPKKIYDYVVNTMEMEDQQEAFRWLTMAYGKIDTKLGVKFMFGMASQLLSFVPVGGDLVNAVKRKEAYIQETVVWYRGFLKDYPKGDKLKLHTGREWVRYFKPLFYAYMEPGWCLDFLSHQRPDIYETIIGNGEYFEFICELLEAVRDEMNLEECYVIHPHEIFRLQKGGLRDKEIVAHGPLFGYSKEEIAEAKKRLGVRR